MTFYLQAFKFLIMDGGNRDIFTAEPAENIFLEIKAYQGPGPPLQGKRREKPVNARDIRNISKEYRIAVFVDGIVLDW